jgi:hypothetical protein
MRGRQPSSWLLFGLVVLSFTFRTEARAQQLERGNGAVAPVQIGPRTYRCDLARVIATDTESGVVQDRWYVPGPCTALREQNGEVVATLGDGAGRDAWTFEWSPGAPNARSAAMLPSGPLSFYALRKEGRLADDLYDDETALPTRTPIATAERERYEALLVEITRRTSLDPTNPWWSIDQGVVLDALGRPGEARAAFERAVAIDERYAIDLMLTASTLDAFDPALGERAFERGFSALKRRGYVPEHATQPIAMLRFLPRPRLALDVDRDYATLARLAWRAQRLAPRVDGAGLFFSSMADAARRKGLPDEARRFDLAAHRAGKDTLFSIVSLATPEAIYAGELLNVTLGFASALLVLLLIKVARGMRANATKNVRWFERFHPFLRFTLGERVGFVLAGAVAIGAAWACAWGVAEIGEFVASPVELGSGSLEHPAALKAAEAFAESSVDVASWETWSREDWASAWRAKVGRSNDVLHNPFRAATSVFRTTDALGTTEDRVPPGALVPSLLMMFFFALALVPPYRSPYALPERGKLAKAVGWLVPGASRFYGAFGFLFAGVFFSWAIGVLTLIGSDGHAATILEAIAGLNKAVFFGVRSFESANESPTLALHRYGAGLIVAHLAWMAIGEWRARSKRSEA